jgi:hypothetical protein
LGGEAKIIEILTVLPRRKKPSSLCNNKKKRSFNPSSFSSEKKNKNPTKEAKGNFKEVYIRAQRIIKTH